jgi:flagellar hook-length control protein FliK
VLAVGLVKAALKDTKSTNSANADATATSSATDAPAASTGVDPAAAGSTAAAVTDIHGDKTAKSDSSASDTAPPTPADPSANQANSPPPQPVAVAISAPVIPAATIDTGSDSGTGQDAAQIAALGDAVKAGTPNGNVGAEAAASGSAPADGGGSAKPPDQKFADAVKPTPALTPPPGQKDLTPPAGPGQPSAADGSQSRPGDAVATTQAVIDHARQRPATNQPADGGGGPQPGASNNSNDNSSVDPNADPKRDPSVSASRIEDITRQALDTAARRSEAPAGEAGSGSAARADGVQSGSTQSSPDGGLVAPAVLTTAAAPAAAPTTNATPTTIPIAGLAVEIAAHAHAGKNRFEIRLDPPELGRIDVRLDVDRDGKVTSRLVVDRPETLDMLRRDAPELERSLQQAGLKTGDNALQFSLRDQGGFGSQNPYSNNGSPASAARVVIPDRDMPPVDTTAAGYGRAVGTSTGLDIRV